MTKVTSIPLYAQIKSSILSRIVAKEWGPGSFLPSETALAAEYGVSQGTLRKALNELALEKKLVRTVGPAEEFLQFGMSVGVLDDIAGTGSAECPPGGTFVDGWKGVGAISRRKKTKHPVHHPSECPVRPMYVGKTNAVARGIILFDVAVTHELGSRMMGEYFSYV